MFSTPEWKTIPWQDISKDMKDVLVDVLVDMPGLVQHFDTMQLCADTSRQDALRLELVEKCWDYYRQLLLWLTLVRQAVTLSTGNNNPAAQHDSEDVVTRVAQAHGMTLFWTTSLVLYSILHMASAPSAVDLPGLADPAHHGRMLAEALPVLLQPSAGLYGQQSAALPLEVVLQYVRGMGSSVPAGSKVLLEKFRGLREDMAEGLKRMVGAGRISSPASNTTTTRDMG